jgi:hypothetical protein
VPPLFSATISNQIPFVDDFIGNHPHFSMVKASNPDYSILPTNTEVEQVIELQELVGAACVFIVILEYFEPVSGARPKTNKPFVFSISLVDIPECTCDNSAAQWATAIDLV